MIITVPGVLVTLFLASFAAFALAWLKMHGGIVLLMLFTAGNLLPQQVIVTSLYVVFNRFPLPCWMSDSMTMYDSYWAVVVQIGFQLGFCVFVLADFMRTLPHEILEAAVVDGAGVWTQYWPITLPLCRPALAALGTFQFTRKYNDFLSALVFVSGGDELGVWLVSGGPMRREHRGMTTAPRGDTDRRVSEIPVRADKPTERLPA